MRIIPALTALAAIACLSPALAQSDSVTVNGVGGRVLIDPATGQERFVPELRQPWQDQPIRLRPPRKHARSTPSADSYASVPEAAPPAKPRRTARTQSEVPADSFAETAPVAPPKPKRTAAARPATPPPQQQSAPISGFSDFTDLISPQSSAPPPKPKASPPPRVAAQKPAEAPKAAEPPKAEKPVQRASIEPSKPTKPRIVAGAKKDTVAFAPNASDPSTSAVAAIRTLAGTLNSALSDASARVQLMAYAGMRGEKSSDTRRLSLKRALVVRQLLIDDGVPAERIDVFALGGTEDDGPLDRVDVLIKS